MLNGIYKVVNTAMREQQRQASIARNLQGSQLPGYRRELVRTVGFSGKLSGHSAEAPKTVTEHRQGGIRTTGSATNFALSGDGFFVVQRPDGADLLTRNGDFLLDGTGQLVTGEGHLVAGIDGPLTMPPNAAPDMIRADATGTLFVESQDGRQVIGQLMLADVADVQALDRISSNYYNVPADGYKPAADTQVLHRALEQSNVSPLLEMADMVESMREFETAHTMLRMTDELLKKRMDS